jgi:integrase
MTVCSVITFPGRPNDATNLEADAKRCIAEQRWEETWREHPETRDPIFPTELSGHMDRNNLLGRHFKPLAQKAGLPKEARLYTVRHTFATLWMESNPCPLNCLSSAPGEVVSKPSLLGRYGEPRTD